MESKRYNDMMETGKSLLPKIGTDDIVFFTPFGSYLYGLANEASDFDYKGVYIPPLRDVLEGREKKSLKYSTSGGNIRNEAGDVDCELFSFSRFMEMGLTGQTMVFDMLYAPESAAIYTSPLWKEIVANRGIFLSKRIMRFVEYSRNQAKKYGIKGSRLGALRKVEEFLRSRPAFEPLLDCRDKVIEKSGEWNGTNEKPLVSHLSESGTGMLHICGKKFPVGAKVSQALQSVSKMVESYGARTETADKSGGVDWKAVAHAFRALFQARSLVRRGEFTYPLPENDFLFKVKSGEMTYEEAEPLLEHLLEETKLLVENSSLPDEPDEKAYLIIESWRRNLYSKGIETYRLRT